jgi:hypothetical protein
MIAKKSVMAAILLFRKGISLGEGWRAHGFELRQKFEVD